ncbi:hypothetical protein HML84_00315 [Alcanivorax sp. IO_7]|nr:hypothetical protein HML84_00315 [Alcanivorax sp. IO_7]
MDLAAAGDFTQGGRISGTDGVTVISNGNVTMVAGARTDSTGDIGYRAGGDLTVDTLHTTTGLAGGKVTLEGRTLTSNATESGSIRAGQVDVRVPTDNGERVYDLVDTTNGKARVSLNQRTLGGKVVEDSQYVADLTHPQSVDTPRLVFTRSKASSRAPPARASSPSPATTASGTTNPEFSRTHPAWEPGLAPGFLMVCARHGAKRHRLALSRPAVVAARDDLEV